MFYVDLDLIDDVRKMTCARMLMEDTAVSKGVPAIANWIRYDFRGTWIVEEKTRPQHRLGEVARGWTSARKRARYRHEGTSCGV